MAISKNPPKLIKVKQIKEIALGKYEFQCNKCKKIHHESAYCVAQRASGFEIVFTCDCKHKTYLPAY